MTSNADLLQQISNRATATQDQRLLISDLEERLKQAKADLRKMLEEELPDLLAQAGVGSVTIEANGNKPAFKVSVKPYVKAVIAASWPDEQRERAFNWLEEHNAGSLITTDLTISLPKEDHDKAAALIDALTELGHTPQIKQAVHWGTLSKWLRESLQRGVVVPLDIIGGEVGREAVIKELDE